jgi:hypothetical protein
MDALQSYFVFHCRQCSNPNRLHAVTLEGLVEHLPSSSNGFPSVALACPACKHVNSCSVPISSDPNPDSQSDRMELSLQMTTLDFVTFLRCEVINCEPPLPLFGFWNETMPTELRRAYAQTWIWAEVKCSKGHPVSNPFLIAGPPDKKDGAM